MTSVSGIFLVFVLCVCAIYFLMPIRYRWIVLLLGSYLFYYINSSGLVIVLAGITVVTFFTARMIECKNKQAAQYLSVHKEEMSSKEKKEYKQIVVKYKKRILISGIIIDLTALLFFKYYNFFVSNTNVFLRFIKVNSVIPLLKLILPLGISFYVLQAIAYMVDVYRGKYEADGNIFQFALFMSYFPQIIQGPIARYDQLAMQLKEGHRFDLKRAQYGCQLIMWGFMKKLILADRLGMIVDCVFDSYRDYQGIVMFLASFLYGIQVYADFSAGMDIARGVSQILGIELTLNFKQPYFARSIEEFWRRWHITLGSWMRDYIFYPLSLSKTFGNMGKRSRKIFGTSIGKKLPSFLAMFIVYFLVGFWHGSDWKYVFYGMWNGVIITSGILLSDVYPVILKKLRINAQSIGWKCFQIIRTIILCSVGRFFSRAVSYKAAYVMVKRMFWFNTPWSKLAQALTEKHFDEKDILVVIIMCLILLVVDILHEKEIKIRELIAGRNIVIRWFVYVAAIFMVLIFGMYGPAYDSVSFIYQQF